MSSKHQIQQDKADEVKALIARYVLLKIEQKKIEAKLGEITQFYDEESLRRIFEPMGDSMMGVIGMGLPRKKDANQPADKQVTKGKIWNILLGL
jgi:hypothetical protein